MHEDRSLLEDKYYLGIKVAGVGLGSVDYEADTIMLDDRAAELFDLPADTAIPRDELHARIHREDWLLIHQEVERLLDPDDEPFIDVEHRVIHRNGDVLWLNARKEVTFKVPQDGGKPVPSTGLVAIIDVTAHKRAQQNVLYLLDELNHRSKNMYSVIQGMARQTFASGKPETFIENFTNRLSGLARNQDTLVKNNWTHSDIRDLAETHTAPFTDAAHARVKLVGPPFRLSSMMAQAIGMAFHELATNASKYGALSGDTGEVHVEWDISDAPDGDVTITWTESGGPTVTPPSRNGFGQTVLKEMAALSVNGSVDLDYRPEGVFWQLTFPKSSLD